MRAAGRLAGEEGEGRRGGEGIDASRPAEIGEEKERERRERGGGDGEPSGAGGERGHAGLGRPDAAAGRGWSRRGRSRMPSKEPAKAATNQAQPCRLPVAMPLK